MNSSARQTHGLMSKKTLEDDVPLLKTTLPKSCSCSNSSWLNNTERGPCWGTERQWDVYKVSSRAHNWNIIFLITPPPTIQNMLSREMLSFHLSFSQCFKIIHLNMGSTPEYYCSSKWSWQQLSADRVYRPDATTYCGFHSPKGIFAKNLQTWSAVGIRANTTQRAELRKHDWRLRNSTHPMAGQLEVRKAMMQSPHCEKGDFFIPGLTVLLLVMIPLLDVLAMWSWGKCCSTH